jgi:hypothetical protein
MKHYFGGILRRIFKPSEKFPLTLEYIYKYEFLGISHKLSVFSLHRREYVHPESRTPLSCKLKIFFILMTKITQLLLKQNNQQFKRQISFSERNSISKTLTITIARVRIPLMLP